MLKLKQDWKKDRNLYNSLCALTRMCAASDFFRIACNTTCPCSLGAQINFSSFWPGRGGGGGLVPVPYVPSLAPTLRGRRRTRGEIVWVREFRSAEFREIR